MFKKGYFVQKGYEYNFSVSTRGTTTALIFGSGAKTAWRQTKISLPHLYLYILILYTYKCCRFIITLRFISLHFISGKAKRIRVRNFQHASHIRELNLCVCESPIEVPLVLIFHFLQRRVQEMADAVINDVVVIEDAPKSNGDVLCKTTRKEMADAVTNDVVVVEASPKSDGAVLCKPTRKRKKSTVTLSSLKNLSSEEKAARVESLRKELEGLFGYYREVMGEKVIIEVSECGPRNAVIAALMEESELPLSRLVDEIYNKLKGSTLVVESVTCASVKSSVLSVGQRMAYGVLNSEADVLEDHSESCFWCWEVMFFFFFGLILYFVYLLWLVNWFS